ncbi:NADH:flavin oxidoreductase/NADH oxidase [Corynebacterium choanae]|nr:NADH:flavin oxidoreductase/NADH oxidase [Corynebacterium choanae]
MTTLFEPLTFRTQPGIPALEARNRIFVAPMCMYSATGQDGQVQPFHIQHYGTLAAGGASLVLVEATAVNPVGRISPADLGLWECEDPVATAALVEGHRRLVDAIHAHGALAGVQLAHAGAKASTYPPHPGNGTGVMPLDQGGWTVVGPGDTPLAANLGLPQPLTSDGIRGVVADFARAAELAEAAGYDIVQIHGAHGYLLHEFLSPLTNTRTDGYGDSPASRYRIHCEVAAAVRETFTGPIGLRVSASDWVPEGVSLETVIDCVRAVDDACALAWVDVSSGGIPIDQPIPAAKNYQVPFAQAIGAALAEEDIVVSAVGMITDPHQAAILVDDDHIDAVSLGRVLLREPTWPIHAGMTLGLHPSELPIPPQYERGW